MIAARYMAVMGVMMAAGTLSRAAEDPLVSGAAPIGAGKAAVRVTPVAAPQYWFGVGVQNLPPAIAKQLKLRPDQGLMVLEVLPDSPAQRAELRAEDVLVDVDGMPLTSYEELTRAANRVAGNRGAAEGAFSAALIPGSCRLTILREGDRKTVTVVPAPRPEGLLVTGGPGVSLSNFTVGGSAARDRAAPGMRSIVLPNGSTAQVGPGYSVDLNGTEASAVSIKRLVSRGDTILATQEVDGTGAVKNRIVMGGKTYIVEKGKVGNLPADLQPLAEQLLASVPVAPAAETATLQVDNEGLTPDASRGSVQERIAELEKQNAQLRQQNQETQRKLERVIELLEQQPK